MLFISIVLLTATKHFDMSREPLLLSNFYRIQNFASQYSRDVCAAVLPFVFFVGVALVSLKYRFIITTTNWLLRFVLCRGLRMSISLYSRGPVGNDGLSCRCISLRLYICVQERHSRTLAYTPLVIWGLWTSFSKSRTLDDRQGVRPKRKNDRKIESGHVSSQVQVPKMRHFKKIYQKHSVAAYIETGIWLFDRWDGSTAVWVDRLCLHKLSLCRSFRNLIVCDVLHQMDLR